MAGYMRLLICCMQCCGEDTVIYRTLLDSLCENGQVNEAVDILAKFLRKGLKAPKSSLMRVVVPSSASYTTMATDLYSEGKICKAIKLRDQMREGGFRPTLRIYEAKIAALCRAGRVYEAVNVIEEEMLKKDCVPNSQVYNTVVKSFCDEGKLDLALRFFENMDEQKGTAPDKETFGVIVDGLCRVGNYVEAGKILEKMLNKSHWLGAVTFDVVMRGLCSINKTY